MSNINDTTREEATRFLQTAFGFAKPLVAANPQYFSKETVLRPAQADAARSGRSPFLLSKINEGSSERYNLKSSGIQQWKMQGIVTLMSEALGKEPSKSTAIDEMSNVLDLQDPKTPKNMSRWHVEFPDGSSLHWTAVSGINIHCASRAVFNTMAERFSPPQQQIDH